MRKQYAHAVVSIGLLSVLLFFVGCKSSNSFVGTWKPTADSDPGMKVDSVTIKEDGTFSLHPKEASIPDLTGKWKADGKKITLEMEGGRPLEMTMGDDGRLTVSEKGKTAHFTRS